MMSVGGSINLDGRYDAWVRQSADKNNALREGQIVQIRSTDGTWSKPMTIRGLRELGNGTYTMRMKDRNEQEWTLTITIKKEHPGQKEVPPKRNEYDNRLAQWIYDKIAKPMHADPDKTLRYTLMISLGIAAAPIVGAGSGFNMAMNADTLRLAAEAIKNGDNGKAAFIIISTQINKLKAAGKLSSELPYVKAVLEKMAICFPGLAKEWTKLNQVINESRNTMSSPAIRNVATRRTVMEAFRAFYQNSTGKANAPKPKDGDIFGYNPQTGTIVLMGNPTTNHALTLPPRNERGNYVYYKYQGGQLNLYD